MGNSPLAASPQGVGAAALNLFYSEKSWISGTAEDQLRHVATLADVQSVVAFPDLHPGRYGPVGCAILADRLHPHLIGNDIGCGISVFLLDLPLRKIRLDKAAVKLRNLEGPWDGDASVALRAVDLPSTPHDHSLGSIGGGNHFCELQGIGNVVDEVAAEDLGLSSGSTLLMVHSGSRSFGTSIFGKVMDVTGGFAPGTLEATDYMKGHDEAVRWATLNRNTIAQRAADALKANCVLIADVPHNLVEIHGNQVLHRKGAAKADLPILPLAGSRDAPSFLLKPADRIATALHSIAHGAGRKYDRRSMSSRSGQTQSDREKLARNSYGGHIICDDKKLLLEEAPRAYKDPRIVVDELESFGLVTTVASLKPLITFKTAREEKPQVRSERERQQRRGGRST